MMSSQDDREQLSWRQRPRQPPASNRHVFNRAQPGVEKTPNSTATASDQALHHPQQAAPINFHGFHRSVPQSIPALKPNSSRFPGPTKGTESDNWRTHSRESSATTHLGGTSSSLTGKAGLGGKSASLASSPPAASTSFGHRQPPGDAFKFPAFSAANGPLSTTKGSFAVSPAPHVVVGSQPKMRVPRQASTERVTQPTGPASPLRPLQLEGRGLAHPNQPPLLGGENWALTPSDSLPSLPGTPRSRAFSSGGGTGAGEASSTWTSASLSAAPAEPTNATAALRAHREQLVTRGFRGNSSPASASSSGAASQGSGSGLNLASGLARSLAAGGSPKRSPLSLGGGGSTTAPVVTPGLTNALRGSPNPSPRPGNRSAVPPNSNLAATTEEDPEEMAPATLTSRSGVGAGRIASPPVAPILPALLLRKGSSTSVASSTQASALMPGSRRASQTLGSANSPGPSLAGSTSTAPYAVYRPPHLRNRGSMHSLEPSVAHYDRVRTPSLRGQSRSPDPSVAASSRAGSRPPSVAPFGLSDSWNEGAVDAAGELRRRISRLSSSRSINLANDVTPEPATSASGGDSPVPREGFQALRPSGGASSGLVSPTGDHSEEGGARGTAGAAVGAAFRSTRSPGGHFTPSRQDSTDDFDLEELMAASTTRSITDSYCLSRRGSFSTHAEPVDIFEIGERIGPGLMHDGHRISIAPTSAGFVEQEGDATGSQLEIVRKLGEGSYAVVYLVREVESLPESQDQEDGAFRPAEDNADNHVAPTAARPLAVQTDGHADTNDDPDDEIYSRTLRPEDDSALAQRDASRARAHSSSSSTAEGSAGESSGPREYALKCLCKRDLSPEMLEVQRLEATIHQSIPPHPHIVTLYRTYETVDWLFLVLEYCPGQDLYYWLERAQDTEGVGSPPTQVAESARGRDAARDELVELGVLDATPPSPSLLASTSGNTLLSRKRLRLVSRMFQQMCDSVQFCHDRGISHRDIKPENFIVEDRRSELGASIVSSEGPDAALGLRRSSSASALGDSLRGSDARVTVKLTDFGLAVAQERCVDFDCGSKPYMAYECRNNVVEWYDPRQADIWSLGVVLLNLIFHRSPFSEPSVERCDSFAAYVYDPLTFLMQAFEGLPEAAARFLASNVFCDVTNTDSEGKPRRRISAKDFGAWAADLVEHMGLERGTEAKVVTRGADEEITSPMEHSRSPSRSTLASLIGSPAFQSLSLRDEPAMIDGETADGEAYPSLFPEYAESSEVSPSPTPVAASQHLPHARAGGDDPGQEREDEDESTADQPLASSRHQATLSTPDEETRVDKMDIKPADSLSDDVQPEVAKPESLTAVITDGAPDGNAPLTSSTERTQVTEASNDATAVDESEADADSIRPAASVTSNPKRRKRGARKARTAAKQELKRSRSFENLKSSQRGVDAKAHPRDAMLAELAEASQTLAREISKAMKQKSGGVAGLPHSPLPPGVKGPPIHPIPHVSEESKVPSEAAEAVQRPDGGSGHESTLAPAPHVPKGPVNGHVHQDGALGTAAAGTKWDSAAQRRERMITERATRGSGEVSTSASVASAAARSWRDRNTSTASFESISSLGSIMTASSVYSTASAPPALAARRSVEASRRLRPSAQGVHSGLESISERDRERDRRGKDLDPSYLAAIFGGSAKMATPRRDRRKEAQDASLPRVPSNAASLVQSSPGVSKVESNNRDAQSVAFEHRAVSTEGGGDLRQIGLRKDASTSTSSLVDKELTPSTPAAATAPATSAAASSEASSESNPPSRRKAGLSKLLTSVRSYQARAG